jgi:hypothetical protein
MENILVAILKRHVCNICCQIHHLLISRLVKIIAVQQTSFMGKKNRFLVEINDKIPQNDGGHLEILTG